MSFDPKHFVIKVQGGREYLPVSARLVWFREAHPDWGIVTSPIEINLHPDGNRPPYAIFSAIIYNEAGQMMATATKMVDFREFKDFLTKAETGAIGRALAYCGFGTQFAPDMGEDDGGYNPPPQRGPQPHRSPKQQTASAPTSRERESTSGENSGPLVCEGLDDLPCGTVLSPSQATFSRRNHDGRLLCPECQRAASREGSPA